MEELKKNISTILENYGMGFYCSKLEAILLARDCMIESQEDGAIAVASQLTAVSEELKRLRDASWQVLENGEEIKNGPKNKIVMLSDCGMAILDAFVL